MPPRTKKIKSPSGNVVSVRKGCKLIVHVADEKDNPVNGVMVGAQKVNDEAVRFTQTTAKLKKNPNKIPSGLIDGVAYFGGPVTPGEYEVHLDGFRPTEDNARRVTVKESTDRNRRNPHAILKLVSHDPLSDQLQSAAKTAGLDLKWLEIKMDTAQGVLGAALSNTLVGDLLRNSTREKLENLLQSVNRQFKERLDKEKEAWSKEQSDKEKSKGDIEYPKWEKQDEIEPAGEQKDKCKSLAIEIAAKMRSLNLEQFTDFITDKKMFSNSCGQTANHLEEIIKDPEHPWKEAADQEMDALADLLSKTARDYPKDCWYCRIAMGPHVFILEYIAGETRIYQSWFGFYTLADRIIDEKRRTLDEFLALLKEARENDQEAQDALFGVPPQDMSGVLRYKLNTHPAGTDQIKEKISNKIDSDHDWENHLETENSVRDHCIAMFGF